MTIIPIGPETLLITHLDAQPEQTVPAPLSPVAHSLRFQVQPYHQLASFADLAAALRVEIDGVAITLDAFEARALLTWLDERTHAINRLVRLAEERELDAYRVALRELEVQATARHYWVNVEHGVLDVIPAREDGAGRQATSVSATRDGAQRALTWLHEQTEGK